MAMMAAGQSGDEYPMGRSEFDYSQLDEQTAKFAWQLAQEIRWLSDSVAQSLIDIGKKLIEVKARLSHRDWLRWLEDEFAWRSNYALQLIRIARAFGDMNLEGVRTTGNALKIATITTLPTEVVTQARERLAAGELSVDDVRDLVRQVDPDLADRYSNGAYWPQRRKREAQQVASHASEFHAAVRNLQVCLSEIYDPVHPKVKRAVDQLTELVAVIMNIEISQSLEGQRLGRRHNTTSQYRGVYQVGHRWRASISLPRVNGAPSRQTHLGYFDTEEEAARAYDAKAKELYGDKARLNFPDA